MMSIYNSQILASLGDEVRAGCLVHVNLHGAAASMTHMQASYQFSAGASHHMHALSATTASDPMQSVDLALSGRCLPEKRPLVPSLKPSIVEFGTAARTPQRTRRRNGE